MTYPSFQYTHLTESTQYYPYNVNGSQGVPNIQQMMLAIYELQQHIQSLSCELNILQIENNQLKQKIEKIWS
jgi:hypothetical protein